MKTGQLVVLAALAALAAVFSLPAGPALGVGFNVTKTADTNDGACNADCSLREAIVAANALAGADTITVPAGTFTLTIAGAGEDAGATGDLDITGDVTINGAGAATTIIDANALDRVFHVIGSVTVSISGLTVRAGSASGSLGGGIRNAGALTLSNTTVSGNSATFGGGIYQSGGGLILNSSTVSGNSAPLEGGGINNDLGTVTLNSSTVSGNSGSPGGGVYSTGTLNLIGSTVANNSSSSNGGGLSSPGTMTLTSSVVSGNTALNDGGGIYSTGAATLNSSTVSGNSADFGGGICNCGGTLILTSSTVSGNSAATGYGGGIYNDGTLTLTSSTASGNSATYGGGIFNNTSGTLDVNSSTVSGNSADFGGGGIYNSGTSKIKNTIVANSPSGGNCTTLPSNGYNLSSDGTCAFTALGDRQNTNPLLGPLAFNGGPTPTHALLDGSPAADAGVIPCPPPATDQRGVGRPQGFRCDIGAYEAPDSDGDGASDPLDTDDDNDGIPDSSDQCRTQPEDFDGFQDGDGCPDPDNDGDGICDPGQTALSCHGSDQGHLCFDPAGTLSCPLTDCRNMAEDYDAFKDGDGCPEPDNDNDGHPDVSDLCPGTDSQAGLDGMPGSPEDKNHNGIKDGLEANLTSDDSVFSFEDWDGVLDSDGCHDSPGDDFDGDSFGVKQGNPLMFVFPDELEVFMGTSPGLPCAATPTANDEPAPDAWPVDFDDNQIVDIFDVLVLKPVFNAPPVYSPRYDFNADGVIDITDVLTLKPFFSLGCLR